MTRHNDKCSMAFGKPSKHTDCPRCEDLKAGAAPRKGWGVQRIQNLNKNYESVYCFACPPWGCVHGKQAYTE